MKSALEGKEDQGSGCAAASKLIVACLLERRMERLEVWKMILP